MSTLFQNMTFDEVVEYTINKYVQENGREKLMKIYEKVMTSNKLSGLLSTSRFRRIVPNYVDILSCLCEMRFFMFKSNFTQVCAAVIFFVRWNEEVNSELEIASPEQLKRNIVSCYEKCHIFY